MCELPAPNAVALLERDAAEYVFVPSPDAPPEPVVRVPPRTVRRPVFTQQWLDLTYLHWRYAPEVVARHLPAGVRPDVCDGSAWIGLVPFRMRRSFSFEVRA